MRDFNTPEEIKAYPDEHGIEALQEMVDDWVLAGRPRDNVIAWLKRQPQAKEVVLTIRQTRAATRNAGAAESQADAATRALVLSKWAIAISILAALAAAASAIYAFIGLYK
jgi:hypothetical protein